jgi:DNA-binding HxlR family transcriptional regulator
MTITSATSDLDTHVACDTAGTCPMDALLRSIMGPWTTYIIWVLENEGTLRFGELKSRIPGISSKVLTERLRHLEERGLISRTYKPTVPPAVSYALTARGHELREALKAISVVALKWRAEDAANGAMTRLPGPNRLT